MKRKRDPRKDVSNKENESSVRNQKIATAGKRVNQRRCQTTRLQRVEFTVPLQSIFNRLYQGLSNRPPVASIGSIHEQIYNTPITQTNKKKTLLGNLYNIPS